MVAGRMDRIALYTRNNYIRGHHVETEGAG